MELTTEIKRCIQESILCWLATSSTKNEPNVSPKEIFHHFGKNKIIIANIASPQTVQNILQNKRVCLSFINILIQKGFQLKGTARIIQKKEMEFIQMEKVLTKMTAGHFPFASIIEISVEKVKPIIAPSYMFYPETTEKELVKNARVTYGL
jgi:uncharacterized protein